MKNARRPLTQVSKALRTSLADLTSVRPEDLRVGSPCSSASLLLIKGKPIWDARGLRVVPRPMDRRFLGLSELATGQRAKFKTGPAHVDHSNPVGLLVNGVQRANDWEWVPEQTRPISRSRPRPAGQKRLPGKHAGIFNGSVPKELRDGEHHVKMW